MPPMPLSLSKLSSMHAILLERPTGPFEHKRGARLMWSARYRCERAEGRRALVLATAWVFWRLRWLYGAGYVLAMCWLDVGARSGCVMAISVMAVKTKYRSPLNGERSFKTFVVGVLLTSMKVGVVV